MFNFLLNVCLFIFLNINSILVAKDPFKNIVISGKEVKLSLIDISQLVLLFWFIGGAIYWSYKKSGFILLVRVPFVAWALISGAVSLFAFVHNIMGGK
ncbi:hypothetical protein ACFX5K_06065 [Rickettsiales bacterium LUAb2]